MREGNEDQPPAAGPAATPRLGSILDRRRWRIALQLGGMGDSVGALLPLFAIGVLGTDISVAAGTAAAYTFGALLGNVAVWGRLADRTDNPRALVIAGTAAQGGLLVLLGARPDMLPILSYAVILGVCSVSMDAALLRLVAGDLEPRERLRAVVRAAALVERGILLGLLFSTIALPLFGRAGSEATALRTALAALGVIILAESAIALSTVGRRRAAPRFAQTVSDLGATGAVVVWTGATTPIQRVLRVAPFGRTLAGEARPAPASERLPDSLLLMLVSLMILHAGFGMQGNLLGLFMREEMSLADGAVISILLVGSVLTNVSVNRVSRWLDSIPAVQIQIGAAAGRSVMFLGFAAIALIAGPVWTVALLIPVYALSQLSWGAIVPANTRRFADLAPASRRGEVAALQSASIGLGIVAGAAVGGVVAESIGFAAMFGLSALLSLAGTALLMRW